MPTTYSFLVIVGLAMKHKSLAEHMFLASDVNPPREGEVTSSPESSNYSSVIKTS